MEIKQIVLVSGLSGAGKTTTMSVLEDLGYRCIDNLPLVVLEQFLEWIENSDDESYRYVALAASLDEFKSLYHALKNSGKNVSSLFLEASDEALTQRYQFTRRKHPVIASKKANTLQQAIKYERDSLNIMAEDVLVIDTSHLSSKVLKSTIESISDRKDADKLTVTFMSFGFKYGVPLDADVVYDVRFLNNPFWVEKLKSLTGNDQEVYDFVMADPRSELVIKAIQAYLDLAIIEFGKEGKSHLTVAIGCTGGKHRSTTLTNYLYEDYSSRFQCLKYHRDIERK